MKLPAFLSACFPSSCFSRADEGPKQTPRPFIGKPLLLGRHSVMQPRQPPFRPMPVSLEDLTRPPPTEEEVVKALQSYNHSHMLRAMRPPFRNVPTPTSIPEDVTPEDIGPRLPPLDARAQERVVSDASSKYSTYFG